MAEYKAIHGFTVQNRTSDPLASGVPGATWSSGGALNTGRNNGGAAGTSQNAGLAFGGNGAKAVTESYNGTAWTELNDLNTGRSEASKGVGGTQTAAIFAGGDPG